MVDLFLIFIGACFANNLILNTMLGIPPAIAVSRKIEAAIGMAIAMMLTLTIAVLVSYPLNTYLLIPAGLGYLQTISFVLLISLAVMLGEKFMQMFKPSLHEKISVYIPLTLINSAALGVALLSIQQQFNLFAAVFFGLGAAAGYGLVIVILAALQERITMADVPGPFRGLPITLITLGMLAMAFMGFLGIFNH